jgi:predicted Ser/Thr protein kinase
MGNCIANKSDKKFIESVATLDMLKKTYSLNEKQVLGAGSFGKVFKAHNLKDKDM